MHSVLMILCSGFMPPEYINNAKVTPKNDIFSLGVIIFYMLAGQKGYDDYSEALRNQNYSARIRKELIESVRKFPSFSFSLPVVVLL